MKKPFTVYDFAKKCMSDKEFNCGGIVTNERKYLDAIGFEYTVKDGNVYGYENDLDEFYKAMVTLLKLNNKYKKGGN